MKLCIALVLALACSSCARMTVEQLGDTHGQPLSFVRLRGSTFELQLGRPAYVTVLSVRPGFEGYSVVFRAVYPDHPDDPRHFPAGHIRVPPPGATHGRTLHTQWCVNDQPPSLEGCRYQAGVPIRFRAAPNHYAYHVVIASEDPIDPFTAAYDLTLIVHEDPAMIRAFRSTDPATRKHALEQALANRPGSPFWSALVIRQ